MLKVLSLGAGVQSTALLLMSIRGELDRIDGAIFADAHWEPAAVHEHLKWLEDQAKYAGVPVFRVTAGDLRADALRSQLRGRKTDRVRRASMPLFVLGNDGSAGMINRQCTAEYKIRPIERKIRELLGLRPRQPWPKDVAVEQFFGISRDEMRPVRMPDALWKRHASRSYSSGRCGASSSSPGYRRTTPTGRCLGRPAWGARSTPMKSGGRSAPIRPNGTTS